MIKKIIKNFVSIFGYNFIKKYDRSKYLDGLFKNFIKNEKPIIFDVGAHKGETVDRFKSLFKSPKIYCFEPVESSYKTLVKKTKNDKLINVYNTAICKDNLSKKINIYKGTSHSSFNKAILNTKWIKLRSRKINVLPDNYLLETKFVKSQSLDNFCKKNKVSHIDILKIDTQGNEDNVLKGAKKLLKKKKIKLIQLEVILQDIYSKYLNIFDVEKYLIPNSYRLLGINKYGNLIDNYSFQIDLLYIRSDLYKKFSKN